MGNQCSAGSEERQMFEWLKKKMGASFIVSDTRKTIENIRTLPAASQQAIAMSVYKEICLSLRELEATPAPSSPERDQVIRGQIERAHAARHLALSHGATDWKDPNWAAAAILEGWLMANSGALGRKAFDDINDLTLSWLTSVLDKSDLEEIERR